MRYLLILLALTLGAQDLRVLTYNVRYPAKGDGPDLWDLRKDILTRSIAAAKPDLIGTQELFELQGNYIVETLPEFAWFGLSRRGNHEDEHMGIFYRKSKFKLIESGNFWLSPTPDVVMSSAWDMSLPRMVTWGLFEITASKRKIYFVNTHFPHRQQDTAARLECARVLAAFLDKLPKAIPAILTGDFNTDASGSAFDLLTSSMRDAKPSNAGGTFHGFKGTPGKDRIDWILYRGLVEFKTAEVITSHENGRYPSDHFPVVAAFSVR